MNKYTYEFYSNLQKAYDYFNERLFENELPQCFITSNRSKNALGYYRPDVFVDKDKNVIDEIAINPDYLDKTPKQILQTLVHEMCHKWQFFKGYKTRRGFHNKQWGEKMVAIGLQPIDAQTGEDKLTGFKMSDRILEGDIFDLESDKLLKTISFEFTNKLKEEDKVKKERKKNRVKYVCQVCGKEVSGKKDIKVICGECEEVMESEE
jgi:predicted SprT family Zn-dependent metalloprotease